MSWVTTLPGAAPLDVSLLDAGRRPVGELGTVSDLLFVCVPAFSGTDDTLDDSSSDTCQTFERETPIIGFPLPADHHPSEAKRDAYKLETFQPLILRLAPA